MTAFVFRNQGLIDPRSISTFGISSKDNANAIGFFGTGLKYAIAILLRSKCKITVWSGMECFNFGLKQERVRNDDFDIVTMNDQPLGFTTELGKTWEMWQAFRELYCNTKDESGEIEQVENRLMVDPSPDQTIIIVEGEPFQDAWSSRSEVILETPPLVKTETVNIHRGASNYLYYRGIRAFKLQSASRYTYNIQRKQDLTEDRTLKYGWLANAAIVCGVMTLTDKRLIRDILTSPKGTLEHDFSYDGQVPGEAFLEVGKALMVERDPNLNASARSVVRTWAMNDLQNAVPHVLTEEEKKALNRAVGHLEKLGWNVTKYPIYASAFLGPDVLGLAEDGTIYISTRCLMMGTKMVAGTILEEFIHLQYGFTDESRSLQNFLIDALITMGERVTGEAL